MDELEISGRRYISSRIAAKEHKYHADYIGQLVRGGKVAGQKVGRAWYVDAESLAEYLGKEVPARGPMKVEPKAAAKPIAKAMPVFEEEVAEETTEEALEPAPKKKSAPVAEEEPEFALPVRKSGRAHTIAAIDSGPVKAKNNFVPVAEEKIETPFIEEAPEISPAPSETFAEETQSDEIFKVENETFIPVKINAEEKETRYTEPEDSFYKVSRKGLRYVSESAPLVPKLLKKNAPQFAQRPGFANTRKSSSATQSKAAVMQSISTVLVAGILSLGVGVLLAYYLHSVTSIQGTGQTSTLILTQ